MVHKFGNMCASLHMWICMYTAFLIMQILARLVLLCRCGLSNTPPHPLWSSTQTETFSCETPKAFTDINASDHKHAVRGPSTASLLLQHICSQQPASVRHYEMWGGSTFGICFPSTVQRSTINLRRWTTFYLAHAWCQCRLNWWGLIQQFYFWEQSTFPCVV